MLLVFPSVEKEAIHPETELFTRNPALSVAVSCCIAPRYIQSQAMKNGRPSLVFCITAFKKLKNYKKLRGQVRIILLIS